MIAIVVYPLIKLFREAYSALCAARPSAESVACKKTGFCAYVMSNTKNSAPEREQLVDALNLYKPVAMGGKWRNNVGGPVEDKIAFQSDYKFVLAIENHSAPRLPNRKICPSGTIKCGAYLLGGSNYRGLPQP